MNSSFPDKSAFDQYEQLEFELPEVKPAPVQRQSTSRGVYDALELLDQAVLDLEEKDVEMALERVLEATEILRA